ncbi:MAG: DUF1820 family protein [Gammaproteobacteria bacterium]|nr:DUF1820 family protein [Gammaproteobacteria bacterium]
MAKKKLYRVAFASQGKVYEIYARKVSHGSMLGFVEIEELVFGARSQVVVDPAEEKIKAEFENVTRSYVPMHAILRIDEVDKQGVSKITKNTGDNVSQLPIPVYTPGGESGG